MTIQPRHMNKVALLNAVKELQHSNAGRQIQQRLKEFSENKNRDENFWFSELCFCLLTSNSKSKTACAIQEELGFEGFMTRSLEQLTECIKRNKHRFHNIKAQRIVEARVHKNIREKMMKILHLPTGDVRSGTEDNGRKTTDDYAMQTEAREWLVANVKGLGMKEASHYLRNMGYLDLSILDRHVLNIMHEYKLIGRPTPLTPRTYRIIEKKFLSLAQDANMKAGELDFYIWYMKAGAVLK